MSGNSSLNVINTVENLSSIVINFTSVPIPYYQNQDSIFFASSLEYGVPSGNTPFSIITSEDTTSTLFSATFSLSPGGIYSLYFAGVSQKIDTLFMQDIIPSYSDSSAGVRFVNLSPGSGPMTVNIAGNGPSAVEFGNLGYKQVSPFKTYSAIVSVGGTYNFEIRDQKSDSLLVTFGWNYSLQKNNTIVVCGTETTSLEVFQVNNY